VDLQLFLAKLRGKLSALITCLYGRLTLCAPLRPYRLYFLAFNLFVSVVMVNIVIGILIDRLDLFRRAALAKAAADANDDEGRKIYGESVIGQVEENLERWRALLIM
jgi:hypothetical protein